MSALTGLKLTATHKPTHMSPVQQRRNKLAKRLWEQIELAKAEQNGTTFAPKRFRSVVQNDTGQRTQVEVAKRIKAWWFVADNGKLVLSIRSRCYNYTGYSGSSDSRINRFEEAAYKVRVNVSKLIHV